MMQRYHLKKMTYGDGLTKINALVLKTLFLFEPNTLLYNPDTEGMLEEGQVPIVNPADPMAYHTVVHWPEPLPVDKLIVLNEVMTAMQLGLESKRGALKRLGEEFPDEKAEEIFQELKEDAKEQAALNMFRAQADATIMNMTGLIPGPSPDGQQSVPAPSADSEEGGSSGGASLPGPQVVPSMIDSNLQNEIVTLAFGTKLAQRRNPEND